MEPVIAKGFRKRARNKKTPRDWISCNCTLKKGLCGAKPKEFCFWLFDAIGLLPEDELSDLFPGTGIVLESWTQWKRQFKTENSSLDQFDL